MNGKNTIFWVEFGGLSCKVTADRAVRDAIAKYLAGSFIRIADRPGKTPVSPAELIVRWEDMSGDNNMALHSAGLRFEAVIAGSLHFYYPMIAGMFQRIFMAMWYEAGGIVLHASAVESAGKAFLFVGQSGRGKTTAVRILNREEGLPVLADNQAFIIRRGGAFELYPFPFTQYHKEGRAHVPIASTYILHHAKQTIITPLAFIDAMRAFQGDVQVLCVPHTPDSRVSPGIQRILFDFARTVPLRHLKFRPDAHLWDAIRNYETP